MPGVNSNDFTVVSGNIGAGIDDFKEAITGDLLAEKVEVTADLVNDIATQYPVIERSYAAIVTDGKNLADIYTLQEYRPKEHQRPIVDKLIEKGYLLVKADLKNPDAVILISPRFELVKNCSVYDSRGSDAAIAVVRDKETGKECVVASLHVPGFNLNKSKIEADDTAAGSEYLDLVLSTLNDLQAEGRKVEILGADMNAFPEKYKPWFTNLEDQGFTTHRLNKATNIDPKDPNIFKEIDFVFERHPAPAAKTIYSMLFGSSVEPADPNQFSLDRDFEPVGLGDYTSNPSDHRLLKGRVKLF
jgi:hypothetical protein